MTWDKVVPYPINPIAYNASVDSENPRISVIYHNSTESIDHTYELIISNAQESDLGIYRCEAYLAFNGSYYDYFID